MWRSFTTLLLLIVTVNVLGAVSVTGVDNINLVIWDPTQGSAFGATEFCVESRHGNSGNTAPYQARVEQFTPTPFELVSPGNPSIPMTVTFIDIGVSSEPLTPGVYSAKDKIGASSCPSADNAQIRVDLTLADLSTALAGNYQGTFTLTVGQNTGSQQAAEQFTVSLTVPEMIRISGLTDIDLGVFDGTNDLNGQSAACVYRNSGADAYSLTATGGSSNGFEVSNGLDTIAFQVAYDNGSGVPGPLVHATPTNQNNADTTDPACGGSPNASVRVTALASDMVGSSAGNYAGILTLIVAPL
jgi:hypothetical protein